MKNLRKLLALLLALTMLVCLCACQSGGKDDKDDKDDKETTEATTEEKDDKDDKDADAEGDTKDAGAAEVNTEAAPVVTEAPEDDICGTWTTDIDFTEYMNANLEASGMPLDIDAPFIFTCDMELNEDNTIKLSVNREKSEESVSAYMDAMIASLIDYLCETSGSTREELEAEVGGDLEAALKEQMDLSDIFDDLEDKSGYYKIDGNKLYTSDDAEEFDENYLVFELNGNELKITEIYDEDGMIMDGYEEMPIELPIIFTR